MRIRVVAAAFALGSVIGATVSLAWLNSIGGPSASVPTPAQTLVVFPVDKGHSARPIPPDWQSREFNGKTYYVVPLS
jgi:hypothetical protein